MQKTRFSVLVLALLVAASSAGLAQNDDRFVSVRIAKTDRYVSPFGTSSEGGSHATVRLYRVRSGPDVLVDKKRVDVRRNGSYESRFARPDNGECRVSVRISGTKIKDEEPFPSAIPDFPSGTATLNSLTTEVTIDALIADNLDTHAYGLMYRPKMRADLGMAFVYDAPSNGGYWMKNTLIPLSIAFVDSNDVIIRIMDMEPCVEDPCPSYDPGASYQLALEVNQGAFEEWEIAEGDRITVDY